jgi:hypothetical protein
MDSESETLSAQATAWMVHGLRLMRTGTLASAAEAIPWFERALATRSLLPYAGNAQLTYDLAASLLNHGEALLQSDMPSALPRALESFDRAIALMRRWQGHDCLPFRRRMVVALHNRALCLQGTRSGLDEAIRSLDEAIELLTASDPSSAEDAHMLACASLNRANALLGRGRSLDRTHAREAARVALAVFRKSEATEYSSAASGMMARHVLCQLIARQVEETACDRAREEDIDLLTDTVDEALCLARSWEHRGEDRLRTGACELLRFGIRVYQKFQPQFLAEFVLENIDPSRSQGALPVEGTVHRAAMEALWRVVRDFTRKGIPDRTAPEFEALLATLEDFKAAEQRLNTLRAPECRRASA